MFGMSIETKLKELVKLEKKRTRAQNTLRAVETEISELRTSINESVEKIGVDCSFSN
jgi:hypothetical protein